MVTFKVDTAILGTGADAQVVWAGSEKLTRVDTAKPEDHTSCLSNSLARCHMMVGVPHLCNMGMLPQVSPLTVGLLRELEKAMADNSVNFAELRYTTGAGSQILGVTDVSVQPDSP